MYTGGFIIAQSSHYMITILHGINKIFGGKTSVEKAESITQPRYTQQSTQLVGGVLGFCVTPHCTFSVKALFLKSWVRIPTFGPLLYWPKIYHAVPRYTAIALPSAKIAKKKCCIELNVESAR